MFGSPYKFISYTLGDIELHYDRPNAPVVCIPIKSLRVSDVSQIKDTYKARRWKLVALPYPNNINMVEMVTKDFIYDCHITVNNISDKGIPLLTYSKLELCKVFDNKIEVLAKYRSPR